MQVTAPGTDTSRKHTAAGERSAFGSWISERCGACRSISKRRAGSLLLHGAVTLMYRKLVCQRAESL